MTVRILAFVLLSWPVSALAQTATSVNQAAVRTTPSQDRFQDFLDAAIGTPTPYALAFGGAVLDQLGNMPPEWSGGRGFAKRSAARFGMGFASDGIGHSIAAVIHHRVKYDPCTCRGAGGRTTHAIGRAFVSMHDDGHSVPNYSLWIAKFSSAGLANSWYPASYRKNDVIREGSVGIVVSGGLNILREFSPELMRLAHLR